MFMFGEGGAKRQIAGIVFGGGFALFAAQFLVWLFWQRQALRAARAKGRFKKSDRTRPPEEGQDQGEVGSGRQERPLGFQIAERLRRMADPEILLQT